MESPTRSIQTPDPFVRALKDALQRDLPGTAAQMKMAPSRRQTQPLSADLPRRSAVLALLHPSPDGMVIFLTERPHSLRHHGGQISFPGGGVEAQDRTLQDTALRETEEELGFSTEAVDILGELTPLFIAPSHNIVYPFVGWIATPPLLHPDPVEVASVLIVPIEVLLDPGTLGTCSWWLDGKELAAPCFRVEQASIWGATAMMLSELLEVLRLLPIPVPLGLTAHDPQPERIR